MKTCRIDDLMEVHRYFDGELDAKKTALFEDHLPGCDSCRNTLKSLEGLSVTLRQTGVPTLPQEYAGTFAARARSMQIQRSRRVAWGLLAAASFLLVSSLSLVGYSQLSAHPSPAVMTQWEEEIVSPPVIDEEITDLSARTLVAIHMQDNQRRERGNE